MLKNRKKLLTQFPQSRQLIDFAETALLCVQPGRLIREQVIVRGEQLSIQGHTFTLRKFRRIFIVGAGKATYGMAEALVDLLGQRLTGGVINVPRTSGSGRRRLGPIEVIQASHPYPDVPTVRGAKKIFALVQQAQATDLVICLMSGGGSSMLAMPLPGVRLADKIKLTKQLMHASADIVQLNTIRKHLSAMKGGRLAQAVTPATMISLIVSDVFGDRLDMIASGPTVPDVTTSAEALAILDRYKLGSPAIRRIIATAGDTPKYIGRHVHNFLIGNNQRALQTIAQQAKRRGLHPLILTSFLRGEAKEVAQVLTAIGQEIEQYGRPIKPPALLIAGGETTVRVLGSGHGGRNQELVLAAVPLLSKHMSLLALATDGVDGSTPTPVAGALADATVADRCVRRGINYHEYLYDNNSYHCLRQVGGLLFTGPTGTNVGDIVMLLVR